MPALRSPRILKHQLPDLPTKAQRAHTNTYTYTYTHTHKLLTSPSDYPSATGMQDPGQVRT
eukprot:5532914-Alexandrium_andersonii.AAC.1